MGISSLVQRFLEHYGLSRGRAEGAEELRGQGRWRTESGRRASEQGKNGSLFLPRPRDRKSTRLNSSHDQISYAVFCLKKKSNIAGVTAGDTLRGQEDEQRRERDEPEPQIREGATDGDRGVWRDEDTRALAERARRQGA